MNENLSYCDEKIDFLIDINGNNSMESKRMVKAFKNSKKANRTKFKELQVIEHSSFKINELNGTNEIKDTSQKSSPIYVNKSLKGSLKEKNMRPVIN